MINGISHAAFRRFCKSQRIALAVLFGSAAHGRTTAQSDLDLAFWIDGKLLYERERGRFHRFQLYAMKQHHDYQYWLASLRRDLRRARVGLRSTTPLALVGRTRP